MLLLPLLGCASPFVPDGVDRWARAGEACADAAEPLNPGCAAVIGEDFGVDPDAEAALAPLGWLATWDLGDEALPDAPYVHAEALATFEAWPGATRTARFYNFAAQAIDRVRLDDGTASAAGDLARYEHGVVYVLPGVLGFSAASVAPTFAHEAAHAVAPDHEPCGDTLGDPGWDGAFGVQAAVASLAAVGAEGADGAALAASAESAASHVLACAGEPG